MEQPTTENAVGDVEKGNPYSLLALQVSPSTLEISVENPQTLEANLPYDPGIPLLGICPKTQHCTLYKYLPVFTAVLSTIARKYKRPKCPSTDEWVISVIHIHYGTLFRCKEK